MPRADRARHAAVPTPPDLSETLDEELVQRAGQGSEAAYRELLRRHKGTVFELVYRLVRDRDIAEDMVQETFIRAFHGVETYRGEGDFRSWILTIANHLAVDHLRRIRREETTLERAPLEITPGRVVGMGTPLNPQSDSTPTRPDLRELRAALDLALGHLNEAHRQCIILRDIEERSYDDIAEILDLPVGTVSTYLTRAREQLRQELKAIHDLLGPSPRR